VESTVRTIRKDNIRISSKAGLFTTPKSYKCGELRLHWSTSIRRKTVQEFYATESELPTVE